MSLPASLFIEILDESGDPFLHQPVPMGTGTSTPAATAISVAASPYNTFWTAPYAGNFFLRITSSASPITSLQMFYLTVTRANGGTLVQAVDVLRESGFYLKYINFEVPPANIILTNTEGSGNIFLNSISGTTITAVTADATPAGSN